MMDRMNVGLVTEEPLINEMKDQLRNPHGCVNTVDVSTDKNQQKLFNNSGDRNYHSFPRIQLSTN